MAVIPSLVNKTWVDNTEPAITADVMNGMYAVLMAIQGKTLLESSDANNFKAKVGTSYVEQLVFDSDPQNQITANADDIDDIQTDVLALQTDVDGLQTDVTDLEADKVNRDEYCETLAAGVADNLVDRKGDGTEQSFTYRTSGGSVSIEDDGEAVVQSIHGNTVKFNQMLNMSTITGSTNAYYIDVVPSSVKRGGSGDHKYLFVWNTTTNVEPFFMSVGASSDGVRYYADTYSSDAVTYSSGRNAVLFTDNSGVSISTYPYFAFRPIRYGAQTQFTYSVSDFQLFDLTVMFGAGNEPTTVAEFRALFPLSYYAYNTGSLLSFNGTGIKTVGFNQWNTSQVTASQFDVDGTEISNKLTDSKDFFNLYVMATTSSGLNSIYTGTFNTTGRKTVTFTVPSGATKLTAKHNGTTQDLCFLEVDNPFAQTYCLSFDLDGYDPSSVGGLVLDEINLNFSWSGYRNGEYEEYWTRTLALPISTYFASGMRSVFSNYTYETIFDELTENKAITRIGAVDMGSMTWGYDSSNQVFYSSDLRSVAKAVGGCKTLLYEQLLTSLASMTNMTFKIDANSDVVVKNTSYTDAAAFKTAMTGQIVLYELATPTEVTISPALNLTYKVSDFGTEQLLPVNGTTPTTSPLVAVIKYSEDFTREIVTMNKNYQSQDSMDALLTTLGTACGGTFTKMWDSTNSKWTYTFTAST